MNKVTITDPGQGEYISLVGDTYRVVISGDQTDNSYALIEMFVPKGGGPGPHSHVHVQEAFFVVEGEIVVTSDEGEYVAKAGSYVNIPKDGPVHMFTNKQEKPAHLLCYVMPSGIEKMFEEVGQPVKPGEFLLKPEMTPELMKKFEAAAKKYDQKLYPPDYFEKKA